MDIDLPILGEDIPDGDIFDLPPDQQDVAHQSTEPAEVAESSSTVAAAPMQQRKQRQAKILEPDSEMELHSTDLVNWGNDYLQTMAKATRQKIKSRIATQAKKNADFWVWGAGIGGVGQRIPGATRPTPFDMFLGENLFQLIMGVDRKGNKVKAGAKRDRDSGIDEATAEESRNVRPRLGDAPEEEIGRAQDDEGMFMVEEEVQDQEIELPRDAPAALDDQQLFSVMPWNSASIRGSSAIPQSGQRGSRMVSASPLKGRGSVVPRDNDPLERLSGEDYDFSGLPPQPSSDGAYLEHPDDDEQQGVRMREPLSAESGNFLAFISDAIRKRQLEEDVDDNEVLFEDLLPPHQTTKMVAVQGLMMVLALGTTGLLNVRQDGAFAEIGVSLTGKAKAMTMHAAEEERSEEEVPGDVEMTGEEVVESGSESDSESEVEAEGQVEQQMAEAGPGPGAAAEDSDDDSDRDSLYDV